MNCRTNQLVKALRKVGVPCFQTGDNDVHCENTPEAKAVIRGQRIDVSMAMPYERSNGFKWLAVEL